jgi:hypothetical protein
MSKITLRPTVPADLPHVVGEPLPFRIRAITVLADDRVVGIGGFAFPPVGPPWAFVHQATDAEGNPIGKKYPFAFHRAGIMAMKMIRASGVHHVVATTDGDFKTGQRWLRRLGFREAARHVLDGKLMFTWDRNDAS